MSDQLIVALKCWAGKSTWFSIHPSDEKNFKKAISNIKKLPVKPSTQEIYLAILANVKNVTTMLGTPDNIEEEAMKRAKEISSKL